MKVRRIPRFLFLGSVAALALASAAAPARGQWRPLGPAGGAVSRPAIAGPASPGVAYVTGGSGLYRTEDGGERWRLVSSQGSSAAPVAVDPRDSGRLYVLGAPTPGHQLFRSDDAGGHFVPADTGLPGAGGSGWVAGLTVSPEDGSLIALAYNQTRGTVYGYGLYASADHGAHWVRRRGTSDVVVVSFSPEGRLWIARRVDCTDYDQRPPQRCTALRLAWSDDGGRGWQRSDWPARQEAGTPALAFRFGAGDPESVFLLAGDFARSNAARLYVARREGVGGWALVTPPGGVSDLVAVDRRRLLATGSAGRHVSLDEGRTWRPLGERVPELWSLQRAGSGRLLGTGVGGAYVSTDRGVRFRSANRGLFATCLGGLASSAADDSLWALGDLGLYQRTGGEAAWTVRPTVLPGYEDYGVQYLARSPSSPDTAYALLFADARHVLVVATHDRGATWSVRSAPALPPDPSSGNMFLAVDPENAERVYWAMLSGLHGLLWQSDDGGVSWSRHEGFPAHFVGDFAIADWTQPEIFAIDRGQLLRSKDGGVTFLPLGQGLPPGVDTVAGQILAFDPGRPGHLFVADERAAYESLDDGATFRPLGELPAGQYRSLGVTAWGELVVASQGSKILRWSSSRGRFEVVGGLDPPFASANITLDARTRTTLFAAPYECRGVWQLDLEP